MPTVRSVFIRVIRVQAVALLRLGVSNARTRLLVLFYWQLGAFSSLLGLKRRHAATTFARS